MLISCYQFLFQLWFLTIFLRTLFACVRQLLLLARTLTLTPPPLRHEPKSEAPIEFEKLHIRIDPETSALPSKPLQHIPQSLYVDEGIQVLVNRPIPTYSGGEDRLCAEEAQARVTGKAQFRTWATLDLTPLRDSTLALLHTLAALAWFILFYLRFTTPLPNKRIVLPMSIAHRLDWVSQWLGTAPVLAYASTWNLEPEDNKLFTANSITSEVAEEMPNHHARGSSTRSLPSKTVFPKPDADALYDTYFIPANPYLLGCIQEPKGSPFCEGGYSDVWRSNVRYFTPSKGLPAKVAVKVLRHVRSSNQNEAEAKELMLRRLIQEVITWLGLPQHPNIVPLVGWTLTPKLSFISPWYKQGNLRGHLENLSDSRRIQILLGIAKGLECLHSRIPPVVHGDLKPENILMSDSGDPLLADFGLSTILGEERMYTSSHRIGGSGPWMSPEQMYDGSRSCQSDVYSFGSLAFTVLTGELPHAGQTDGQITLKVCDRTDPKDPVEDWTKYPRLHGPIQDLLNDCWSRPPDARPPMSAIVRRLTTLLESSEFK